VSEFGVPAPPAAGTAAPGAVAPSLPLPPSVEPSEGLGTARWGMIAFLLSEVAFFSTLIVTYITFMGQDRVGPTPGEVLSIGLVIGTTACLLSSSLTIHLAEGALHKRNRSMFAALWALTIVLGAAFLIGTGYEWKELIFKHGLTIDRNLFGTTFYTLVGFHGLHVTVGLICLIVILFLALGGEVNAQNSTGVVVVSWYWHFVDVVWVVVFTVVYVIGR
jgi:cytochrome c oxidase subunit 3/cytochrome o ubiquinol oxidase subunit 3